MAANILEIFKQMQSDLADQKNNIRNLHEKFTFIEAIITDLPKILVTIERLEQVIKNNMVAFENIKTEINSEDNTMSFKSEEMKHKKNMEIIEVIEPQSSPAVIIIEDTEMKYEDGGNIVIKEENEPTWSTKNQKQITDKNQSERKVKGSLKEVPRKLPVKKTSKVRKQKSVGSQTSLKPDRIKKHNKKQKEILVAVTDEHPVMKQLRKGVVYTGRGLRPNYHHFKLGINGLETSYFKELLEEYPDLSLLEAIREWLRSLGPRGLEVAQLLILYNTNKPLTYGKDGELVPLDSYC